MEDIELAETNVDLMIGYLRERFAISAENIRYLKDATRADLAKEHRALMKLAKEVGTWNGERKLLWIVVYSGHGV